jgi:hypothetical protein
VIVITLCAVIAGANDWVGIAACGKEKPRRFKTFLELARGIAAHHIFGRVFSLIEPEEFGKGFVSWIRSAFPMAGSDVIAIDGDTARRSHHRANGKSARQMIKIFPA